MNILPQKNICYVTTVEEQVTHSNLPFYCFWNGKHCGTTQKKPHWGRTDAIFAASFCTFLPCPNVRPCPGPKTNRTYRHVFFAEIDMNGHLFSFLPKVLLYFQVQTPAPTKDNTLLYHQNDPKRYHHQGRLIKRQEDQFLRRIQYSHPHASVLEWKKWKQLSRTGNSQHCRGGWCGMHIYIYAMVRN